MRHAVIILLLVAALGGLGCGLAMKPGLPAGFAHYERDRGQWRAIAADGVRLRARETANDPYGTLAMWHQAVTVHLEREGYHVVEKKDLAAAGGAAGLYTEYRYLYFGNTYAYAVALFADRRKIRIIEATGPEKEFLARKAAIMQSLAQTRVAD